ncbi:MAG TPA: response regulator transcription factor [Propionibacteriaceae bacterium]|nr:response regulator transcription factor [Propionibacteriaceae bacterium]
MSPTDTNADTRTHVLVVDDEVVLAGMVANYLQRAGHRTTVVHDGLRAVDVALETRPDVIVLDLNLPGLDGIHVCKRVREESDCYIIMLTARDEEEAMLIGLSTGADDYLTKPFSARELVARVDTLLRRPRSKRTEDEPEPRHIGALTLDPASRLVFVDAQPVDLTKIEFDLLNALSARPRTAFTRRALIDQVWGPGWVGDEHLVDVHIGHLRRKLGDAPERPFVLTVRGVGYRMGPGE